jgi:hypothetical protein
MTSAPKNPTISTIDGYGEHPTIIAYGGGFSDAIDSGYVTMHAPSTSGTHKRPKTKPKVPRFRKTSAERRLAAKLAAAPIDHQEIRDWITARSEVL